MLLPCQLKTFNDYSVGGGKPKGSGRKANNNRLDEIGQLDLIKTMLEWKEEGQEAKKKNWVIITTPS